MRQTTIRRSSVQWLELFVCYSVFWWQPLLAMKLNSVAVICCIRTWEFCKCCCWRNDSTDSGYIMLYKEPDKSRSKWKPGMTSRTWSANSQKSSFRSEESGMVVQTAQLPKFLMWKSLFICHWLWWYSYHIAWEDFIAKHMSVPFSQVSSDKAHQTCNESWEREWIFNLSALAYTISGSDCWTNPHCR